jgi:WD40 repeat protein
MALADLRPLKEWAVQNPETLVFDTNYKRYATTNNNGDVVVRSAEDDRELAVFPHLEALVHSLAFSPNGEFVGVGWGASDYFTRAYDASTGAMIVEFTNTAPGAFCFSPDSRLMAIAHKWPDGTRTLQLHDLQTRRQVSSFQSGLLPQTMKFSPTADRLATASANASQVQIWDARNGAILQTLDHPKPVSSFDWHPQGDRLAVAGHDKLIHIWSFAEREQRKVELNHGDVVIFAFYSHRGDLVASIGWNNLLRLWNPNTARELLTTAAIGFRGAPFSADDRRIAYWPTGQRLRLCEVAAGLECRTFCFGDTMRGAFITDFSPDGQLPALVLRLHLRLWDESRLRDIARVPEEGVVTAMHAPTDRSFLTAGRNGLKRWPMELRRTSDNASLLVGPPETFGPPGPIQGLWQIHNGQRLLVLRDRTLHVLDLATRRDLKQISLEAESQSAASSQNGKWFVTVARDAESVRVWDIQSGRAVASLPALPTYPPISLPLAFTPDSRIPATEQAVRDTLGTGVLAFTPDSRILVTGSRDGYAAWESDSWKPVYSIRRSETGGTRGRVAFSADGTMGAVTYGQNSIRLFDPATGHEFATLEPPEPSVIVGLIFSPDGGQLIANTDYTGMHYWDLRLIRSQLASIKLDWNSMPIPPAATRPSVGPLQVTFLPAAN